MTLPRSGNGGGLNRKTPLSPGTKGLRRSPLNPGTKGLQRGKSLNPGKGLAQGSKGLRRTPLQSADTLAGQDAKPWPSQRRAAPLKSQPARRTAQETWCRTAVADRSGGLCELCGGPGPLEKAHRVARSQGGAWDTSNVLDLCHRDHADNHSQPARAYRHGWHLRSHQKSLTEPTFLTKNGENGWVLLDDDGGWEWHG